MYKYKKELIANLRKIAISENVESIPENVINEIESIPIYLANENSLKKHFDITFNEFMYTTIWYIKNVGDKKLSVADFIAFELVVPENVKDMDENTYNKSVINFTKYICEKTGVDFEHETISKGTYRWIINLDELL